MLMNLEEACFNNLTAYWKALAVVPPSSITETPDYVCVNTNIKAPLFNPVFLKPAADKFPVVPGGSIHSFWYDSKRNKKIAQTDVKSFEPLIEKIPVMSIRLDRVFEQKNPPKNIIITKVENGRDLSEWITPVQVAFELDTTAALRYRTCLENASDKMVHFIARKQGHVVGAASLYLHDEMAGFYNLAVLPEHRQLGIGTALHYVRLGEAQRRGYTHATLQATPKASKLDASLGFEIHSEVSILALPR